MRINKATCVNVEAQFRGPVQDFHSQKKNSELPRDSGPLAGPLLCSLLLF